MQAQRTTSSLLSSCEGSEYRFEGTGKATLIQKFRVLHTVHTLHRTCMLITHFLKRLDQAWPYMLAVSTSPTSFCKASQTRRQSPSCAADARSEAGHCGGTKGAHIGAGKREAGCYRRSQAVDNQLSSGSGGEPVVTKPI